MKEIINKLKLNELFKEIDEEDFEEILLNSNYYTKDYKKGMIIAQEDDNCSSLGLVINGAINIERIYSSGKSIILNKLVEGDVFGEALVFSNYSLYPATIIAVTDCRVIFIKREDLLRLWNINKKILENFIVLLSDKVIMLNSKIKSISLKSVKHRVINYILEESHNQGSKNIVLKDSKETISALLGIPRPSLSRELIRLRDQGYIDFDRQNIEIINQEDMENELFE